MRITTELIKKMNPCESRFNNFTTHNPNFNDELHVFLSLDNITYNDKIWVCVRLLTKNQLVHWSILCAESVKHIYESKYPESKVLSELFDYLKSINDFENLSHEQKEKIKQLRSAANAAAYAADAAAYAAYAADAAAANAAAYAADAAADAAAYAAYAADAAAANAAAYAAADAEEKRNLNLLYIASLIEVEHE